MWQDYVLTIGQAMFAVILARMAWDRQTAVNPVSSWLNAITLAVFAGVFWTLGLYGTAATEVACAVLWAFIAIYRSSEE